MGAGPWNHGGGGFPRWQVKVRAAEFARSCRQLDRGNQAAGCAIGQRQLAALLGNRFPRNRQPEPDPAGAAIARGLETVKRLENPLQLRVGNARPAILDGDLQTIRVRAEPYRAAAAAGHGVADEVCRRPAQRDWPTDRGQMRRSIEGNAATRIVRRIA